MRQRKYDRQTRGAAVVAGALLLALLGGAPASAGPTEQALQLHDRLAGVPPSAAVLTQMAADIAANNAQAAAQLAMNNSEFLQRDAEEFRRPVDQSRSVGVRAAERLHRHGHRHGARRR